MNTRNPLDLGGGRFVHHVEHDGKDYRIEVRADAIKKVSVVYRREAVYGWTHIWKTIPMDSKRGRTVISAFIDDFTADDGRNPDGTVA
jgi:hypothetical protein